MNWRFFAHFNRINMQRGKPYVWTIHWRGRCIQCSRIEFKVSTHTSYNPFGRQPRAVIRGRAARVKIEAGRVAVVS